MSLIGCGEKTTSSRHMEPDMARTSIDGSTSIRIYTLKKIRC